MGQIIEDITCPYCGHVQDEDGLRDLYIRIDEVTVADCGECGRDIQIQHCAITWFEIEPERHKMQREDCALCQSETAESMVWWDKDKRNVYHLIDHRPTGGQIEQVWHDPPWTEVEAKATTG